MSSGQVDKIMYAYHTDYSNQWYSSIQQKDRDIISKAIQFCQSQNNYMVVEPLSPHSWWNDGSFLHTVNETDSIILFRCAHLPSLLSSLPCIYHKYVLLLNPLNHPVLPTTIRSLEEQQEHLLPPIIQFEYARLRKGNPKEQTLEVAPNLSVHLPSYRTFLPVLSFTSKRGYLDIPFPSIVDYVLIFKEELSNFEGYCKSIVDVWKEMERAPHKLEFMNRSNCLFFRGNCQSHYGIPALLAKLNTSNTHLYDIRIVRPTGLVESTSSGLQSVTDNRWSRYYMKELSPYNYSNIFQTLLNSRFALVVPDAPEMMFMGLYLLAGCVVFYVESDHRYWWSDYFQPNVHYIPVKEDLSDLEERFAECCRNPEQYQEIAKNARTTALEVFSQNTLLMYMKDISSLLFRLPAYKELNQLYAGGKKNYFSSPDVDYYKLQYLKRYRFPRVNPKEKCDCDACERLKRVHNSS